HGLRKMRTQLSRVHPPGVCLPRSVVSARHGPARCVGSGDHPGDSRRLNIRGSSHRCERLARADGAWRGVGPGRQFQGDRHPGRDLPSQGVLRRVPDPGIRRARGRRPDRDAVCQAAGRPAGERRGCRDRSTAGAGGSESFPTRTPPRRSAVSRVCPFSGREARQTRSS
ncbi:MAG: hypothetical protein H6Q29_348, partial [Bacteroidetes bacterium]|nr:hypothetical protein [Bacteroidota bacterium]